DGRLHVLDAAHRAVDTIQRGELAGEVSFVDRLPATATVIAAEASHLFGVDRTQLMAKLDRDAGVAARFYRALAAGLATSLRSASGHARLAGGAGQVLPIGMNPHLAAARFQRLLARMASAPGAIVLSGNDLTVFDVARVATQSAVVAVSPLARERMIRSREVV